MISQAATSPEAFVPVIVLFVLALAIAVGLIVASHIFGQRPKAPSKFVDAPYECGLPMPGGAHPRFGVKFYLVAMLFVIFDIEVVYLFPLAPVYRSLIHAGAPILVPLLVFIAVLAVGIIYEIRKGALKWDGQ